MLVAPDSRQSPHLCYATRSSRPPNPSAFMCMKNREEGEESPDQGHSTNDGTSFFITWERCAAERCTVAESRSGAALTSNLHGDFSRQSPNTKHNFWVLYLGLREGASSGKKDCTHCARRKRLFFLLRFNTWTFTRSLCHDVSFTTHSFNLHWETSYPASCCTGHQCDNEQTGVNPCPCGVYI